MLIFLRTYAMLKIDEESIYSKLFKNGVTKTATPLWAS
jgi:hypothetical protein